MIDHVGLNVADYARSKEFYEQALAPIGYEIVMDFEGEATGLGVPGRPDLWLVRRDPVGFAHIAFVVEERERVDAFHAAALGAGGTDNGGPGTREHYHPTYYAAFVLDPDGNNIEVVCHTPA